MARILVVEDNETNLDLMLYLLEAFGHIPLTARNGLAGIEVTRRERPDLVLLDVHMPHMDGYEVACQLKSEPDLKVIPLVAVTALAMVGDRDKVLAAGFDGYIAKPLDPETFVGQVEAFLPAHPPSTLPPTRPVTTPVPPVQANQVTILVVDNLAIHLDLARSTLEPFGYEVITAGGVSEGLALARQTQPDLILSDLNMTDGSGYEFISAAKADPKLKAIPFIFITSTFWEPKDRIKALALGAVKVLLRPLEPQQLLAEIEACLQEVRPGGRGDEDRFSASSFSAPSPEIEHGHHPDC